MKSKGALAGIPPRPMNFNPDEVPYSYYAHDRAMTVFWNTLSMLFPEGEQFFVRAVRHYRDQITDVHLQNQISGFIGQEAFHTKAHNELNAKLKQIGYPVDEVNKLLGKALHFINKHSPSLALQATCILEHYTATMGMQLLDNTEHNASVLSEARKVWLHHAVEEVEHRTVSFDVLEAVGGTKGILMSKVLFLPVSVIFAAVVAVLYSYNLFKINISFGELRSIRKLAKLLLIDNAGKYLDWFRLGFHPLHHQSLNIAAVKRSLNIGD